MIKVSDYITKYFEEIGIKDIFMFTGGAAMHLNDSFGKSEKIKYYCFHNEQSLSIATESYAKIKNDLGVCLVTNGPGATNAITGLTSCYLDSVPTIFISGQTKVKQTINNSNIVGLRQFGLQEVDIVSIVKPITKYAIEITESKKIKYYLDKAVFEAKNGRPGPVWLSIPLDIQGSFINEDDLVAFDKFTEETIKIEATDEEINYILKSLKEAKRPVVISGHGIRIAEANKLLDNFCTRHKIPVVTSIMGLDNLEYNHICNIGLMGTKGTRAGNFTVQNSDLVISLGCRLSIGTIGHEYRLFARQAKIIVVDIDKNEHLKQTIKIDRIINCDVKNLLEKLIKNNIKLDFSNWLNKCNDWKINYPVVLEEYNNDKNGINLYKFIEILNKHIKSNITVVSGNGSALYVLPQTIKLKQGQRYIVGGGLSTMGYCLPACIGVAIALNKPIISVEGEGSFMLNLQELEVLKYHNLDIKIFIVNNQGYHCIRQTQKTFFNSNFVGESSSSGISFPNFEKVVNAFDIKYYKLENINQCERQLNDILLEKGPAIIEVIVDKDMEIMPNNISEIKPDGKMVSKPLEDMYPFLDREVFKNEMIVDIVEE